MKSNLKKKGNANAAFLPKRRKIVSLWVPGKSKIVATLDTMNVKQNFHFPFGEILDQRHVVIGYSLRNLCRLCYYIQRHKNSICIDSTYGYNCSREDVNQDFVPAV